MTAPPHAADAITHAITPHSAELDLLRLLRSHGYERAVQSLRHLEERCIYHCSDAADEAMLGHIHFLRVLLNAFSELV